MGTAVLLSLRTLDGGVAEAEGDAWRARALEVAVGAVLLPARPLLLRPRDPAPHLSAMAANHFADEVVFTPSVVEYPFFAMCTRVVQRNGWAADRFAVKGLTWVQPPPRWSMSHISLVCYITVLPTAVAFDSSFM